MQLMLSTQAKDDLKRITGYIAHRSKNSTVARNFKNKILAKCKELASIKGKIGVSRPDLANGLRSHPFGNYIILFMYSDDSFKVVTIIEGHRDIESMFTDE